MHDFFVRWHLGGTDNFCGARAPRPPVAMPLDVGGVSPPMVGTLKKNESIKIARFSRELNVVKIHGKELTHRVGVPIDDRTSPTSLTRKKRGQKCCTRSHIYITAFSPKFKAFLGFMKFSRAAHPLIFLHPPPPSTPASQGHAFTWEN